MNHYETVFILNPVLSDTQIKETVQKFEDYLVSKGAEMFEYKVAGEAISSFELEFWRDDSVMRYLTVKLDKHAAAWAEKRRERVKSEKK